MLALPVAYIRRSVARTGDPGDVSRDFQTDKVRALANGDGATLRILDGDWGRSAAGEKTDKRLAFLALLDAIERGEVSTLYAYSADRLARSVEWAARLLNACERAGAAIVTGEGRFAPGDDGARMLFQMLAVMNENALRGMTTKSTAVAGKRRERGDHMGRAPYGYRHRMVDGVSQLVARQDESPAHVVDVFIEAGTYNEAAKALNAEHFPTRFGKGWDPSTVRHVVLRERPELVPAVKHRGSPATKGTRLFARLLRCPHADRHPATPFLTSSAAPGKAGPNEYVRYYCRVAHSDATHPRPYIVAESKVLPWAKAELAKLGGRMNVELRGDAPMADVKGADLERRRLAVIDMYESGDIDKAEYRRRMDKIAAELPAVELGQRAVASLRDGTLKFHATDWGNAAAVNAELRNLWQYVELDPKTMAPVRAEWTIGNDPSDA